MKHLTRSLLVLATLMLFVSVPASHAINHIPKKINMRNTLFGKLALVIKEDQRVQWVNKDVFDHHPRSCEMADGVTCNNEAGDFDGGIVPAGGVSAVIQFNASVGRPPGVYAYHCALHPEMVGVIVVKPK